MKCLLCENLSIRLICSSCQKNLLQPSLIKREIDGLEVFSFYKYREIEELVKTKHHDIGSGIFKILANLSFAKFAREFNYPDILHSLSIDDRTVSYYSHTAILNHALKSQKISPIYRALRAKNRVSYSGKSRQFREENPRNFHYQYKKNIEVIIVDDIITTGLTIKEAKETLEKSEVTPVFALTLADARD